MKIGACFSWQRKVFLCTIIFRRKICPTNIFLLSLHTIYYPEMTPVNSYNFIDLFAGLGGIRIGLERAARKEHVKVKCVLTSEVKKTAIESLQNRYKKEKVDYDVTKIHANTISDNFDIVLAGFPCQAFSQAGLGMGFLDKTRGTLFFDVLRLIIESTELGHKPKGFILENVEGLINHGGKIEGAKYGRTLTTILESLDKAGYNVIAKLLDASEYGCPQMRKRVYIVGVAKEIGAVDLENLPKSHKTFGSIMEHGLPTDKSAFAQRLIEVYGVDNLPGKAIKDKRGGENNIHSWDVAARGATTSDQRQLLNALFLERRKKHWCAEIGIDWMDGIPLTKQQIETFYTHPQLQDLLDDLVHKGYLTYEHPKKKIKFSDGENTAYRRIPDETKEKGYNIVAGKLSFDYTKFLDPQKPTHTMVAMDMERVGVIDGDGIRHLTINEGLKLFGYSNYNLSYLESRKNGKAIAFDLLGNSVCVPVIEAIARRLIQTLESYGKDQV